MSETFLTQEEMTELSGIKTGKKGRTREQLQAEWLRTSGIPFWTNARGKPIVARVSIEGRGAATEPPTRAWQPRVVNAR
ncbi:DUF4224 domain-containing protein [Chitinasiproducens palmae]|uniref:DUF4224 domain-containing protein n=1 Tax=Chitinasiproducens palmae TaxID=1770053 RepID=A0A1H2PPI4_9BURK|nr:DUF4224 domain-containing protein [Chitinasiproducens palmae]SDV48678.1 protein of unknown function [Chitinasiproducens palmae]